MQIANLELKVTKFPWTPNSVTEDVKLLFKRNFLNHGKIKPAPLAMVPRPGYHGSPAYASKWLADRGKRHVAKWGIHTACTLEREYNNQLDGEK